MVPVMANPKVKRPPPKHYMERIPPTHGCLKVYIPEIWQRYPKWWALEKVDSFKIWPVLVSMLHFGGVLYKPPLLVLKNRASVRILGALPKHFCTASWCAASTRTVEVAEVPSTNLKIQGGSDPNISYPLTDAWDDWYIFTYIRVYQGTPQPSFSEGITHIFRAENLDFSWFWGSKVWSICWETRLSHEQKTALLSMKSWLFNDGILISWFTIIPT